MRIYVKVSPRSSKNEVIKISEGEYKVKITAPPVDGEANSMLIKVLAEYFGISKSSLTIIGGKSAKIKIIEISGKEA
ncbi:MAG TPA: hypothetical protein DIT25_02510 [Candidatus Moranbacteria bacterium]|nr:hypothetical protein [Candidatus Moranbacteria bacterium]